jgi:hypothetical protein
MFYLCKTANNKSERVTKMAYIFILLAFFLGVDYGKHGEKYWFD